MASRDFRDWLEQSFQGAPIFLADDFTLPPKDSG